MSGISKYDIPEELEGTVFDELRGAGINDLNQAQKHSLDLDPDRDEWMYISWREELAAFDPSI